MARWGRLAVIACLSLGLGPVLSGCGEEQPPVKTVTVHAASDPPPAEAPKPTKPDPSPQPIQAAEHVAAYYQRLDGFSYRRAWDYLPASTQSEVGGFRKWRRGHDTTLRTIAHNVRIASSSASAITISLDIEARDVDACDGHTVRQYFSGSWRFARMGDEYVPESLAIAKVGGGTPHTLDDPCPVPKAGGTGFGSSGDDNGYAGEGDGNGHAGEGDGNAFGDGNGFGGADTYQPPQDYYHPPPTYGGDIDCDEGPQTDFSVGPSDPNGFDADGDGIGCES